MSQGVITQRISELVVPDKLSIQSFSGEEGQTAETREAENKPENCFTWKKLVNSCIINKVKTFY